MKGKNKNEKLVKTLALVLAILTLTFSMNAFADDEQNMDVVILKAPESKEAASGTLDDIIE